MIEWIRFIGGTVCIIFGLFFIVSSVIGNFRFKFALNRMHSAALGDTLGLLGVLVGLGIFNGFNGTTLKLLAIIVLFWITSPVTSHLIMLMEISNGRYISEGQEEMTDKEGLENYSVNVEKNAIQQFENENADMEGKDE